MTFIAKCEGMPIKFIGIVDPNEIETIYIERRVPKDLEKEIHDLIDKFIINQGYNLENI